MYESTIFKTFSVQNTGKDVLNTHLPQEKFYFDEFNQFMPKVGF